MRLMCPVNRDYNMANARSKCPDQHRRIKFFIVRLQMFLIALNSSPLFDFVNVNTGLISNRAAYLGVRITKTCLFKYIENFTTMKMKIFR